MTPLPAPPPAPPTSIHPAPSPGRDPAPIGRQSRFELPAPSTLAIQRKVVIPPRLVVHGRVVRPQPVVTLAATRRRVMS